MAAIIAIIRTHPMIVGAPFGVLTPFILLSGCYFASDLFTFS